LKGIDRHLIRGCKKYISSNDRKYKKGRPNYSKEDILYHIEQWRKSGQSKTLYAKLNNIARVTINRWTKGIEQYKLTPILVA
jgi:hypothetical protein